MLAPRPRFAFSAGTSGRRHLRIVLDALTWSTAPRRDNCSLIRAAWSCGKAGGPFPQSLTMCGSRRVAEAGEEKWRGCARDGTPGTFHSHAGEGTQSPHRHKLTRGALEIDREGAGGGARGEEPTKPHRQLQEEFQRTRDLGCGCAYAPIVRCKEAELCPVGAGRWPRGHRLAGSCEPVPGETLVNDPLKGGVPGSAAVRSQSAPAASYLPPALSY